MKPKTKTKTKDILNYTECNETVSSVLKLISCTVLRFYSKILYKKKIEEKKN